MDYELKIYLSCPRKFTPFSFLCKLYIRRPYSHACIGYVDEVTGVEMVAEAAGGDFHIETFSNWYKKNKIKKEYELKVNSSKYRFILKKVLKDLQVKYSVRNIIGVIFYDAYLITKLKFLRKISAYFQDNSKGLICSEAVAFTLTFLDIEFKRPLDFIRPDHVERALKEYEAG